MKAKKALGFQYFQAKRPTAELVWCWHGWCCGLTWQVAPWSQMHPWKLWVSHSTKPGTRPAPKHSRHEASLPSQWPAWRQRSPGIASSFMKTEWEKSYRTCDLSFPKSVRPQHSSEQKEKEDAQSIPIQQELCTFALNKHVITEFLNKWRGWRNRNGTILCWPFP